MASSVQRMNNITLYIGQNFNSHMKIFAILIILVACLVNTGCGTLLGGPITVCQSTKPLKGDPRREIRPVAFFFDLLFWPFLIVDFTTGGMYRPCENDMKSKVKWQ
jgi:hypothetical protein